MYWMLPPFQFFTTLETPAIKVLVRKLLIVDHTQLLWKESIWLLSLVSMFFFSFEHEAKSQSIPWWAAKFKEKNYSLTALGSKITVNSDCSHEVKRRLIPGRKGTTNLDSILKSRDITANKGLYSQSYGFSSSHVQIWELDHRVGWAPKNWCFWTEVLEKTLESPLDSKEIKPVNPKGNQPWIFTERTDPKAEVSILQPSDAKSQLTGKVPDAGKDWGQEEKGVTGWDGWMASPTQEAWVWASSGRWRWAGKPGVLQSTVSQSWTQLSDWTTTTTGGGIGKWETHEKKKPERSPQFCDWLQAA